MDNCVVCFQRVRPRQHALQCNACQKWQHHKCETGISQTLYRQLCRGDETLSRWRCKDCSRLPPPLIMTDDSLNNMSNILPIAESTHLTAAERHDVHDPTYGDLIDEAMNTDVINSVNDSDMLIDNSSVQLPPDVSSHTWTAPQKTEVTCTFNIDASFKVTENQCAFHLGQAMWRKLQELGLRATYIQEKSVYQFCRKVMALPFFPAEHIAPAFARLKDQSKMIPLLYSWVDYVESTWITNITFPVDSWSVFRKSVRTNNDVEGWHRRINAKAGKANLPFCVLVSLLFDEATSVVRQIQLVSEKS